MVTVNEAANNAKGQLAAELAAGVNFLSENTQVQFLLYRKLVLPLDGFVFWIRDNLTLPTQPIVRTLPDSSMIAGSLHYSTELAQDEDATIAYNTIVFTALTPIDLFQDLDPKYLYLATYQGIRFAFSSHGKYYQQAGLWHYMGVAVTSLTDIQIIDDLADLPTELILSNSLPIWLAMYDYVPPYPGFRCPFVLYPSFLVPQNESPPYGSVHIERTEALAEIPFLGRRLSSYQLAKETVKVTTYGATNLAANTFLNFVIQYSRDWNFIGLRNMPIIHDLHREQAELQVLTQKKEITFEINYLQTAVRDVARQHILRCIVWSETGQSHIDVHPVLPPYTEPFHGRP
jgi:hypothetical protein